MAQKPSVREGKRVAMKGIIKVGGIGACLKDQAFSEEHLRLAERTRRTNGQNFAKG